MIHNNKIIEWQGNIHHSKHIMHKAIKLNKEYKDKKHADNTSIKRAMMKKYYAEHPKKKKLNKEGKQR